MQYHIVVIEDEVEIQKAIRNFLVREGYQVTTAETGEAGLEIIAAQDAHLVLLDMMLPGIGGEEVLRNIRQKSSVPVIIISALDDELIQQDAYSQSADDYVVKPFSIKILVYKIAALLRRVYDTQQEEIIYDSVRLIVNNYEVYEQEQPIALTPKEFELLQVMMLNKGKVYTREQLLTLVWGYEYYGDARTIDVHIKNIRQKLTTTLITTVKGIGYRIG